MQNGLKQISNILTGMVKTKSSYAQQNASFCDSVG